MLHHDKLPYSCEGEKKDIVIGFLGKHIRRLLLSDEDMHEVLSYGCQLSAHMKWATA